MFVKILLVGASIVALMVVAQTKHWPQRIGVTGTCWAIQPPLGRPPGAWYACKQGVLTGFPTLESDGCSATGLIAHREIWLCAAPLVSLPGY